MILIYFAYNHTDVYKTCETGENQEAWKVREKRVESAESCQADALLKVSQLLAERPAKYTAQQAAGSWTVHFIHNNRDSWQLLTEGVRELWYLLPF